MSDRDTNEDVKRSDVLRDVTKTASETKTKRRGFLRSSGGIAASLAALPLVSRVTSAAEPQSAEERLHELAKKHESPEVARKAVEETGGELLRALSTRGLLADADVNSLGIEEILPHQDSSKVDDGVIVLAYDHKGTLTTQVQIIKRLADSRLRIMVEPQLDRSFALVEPDADEESATVITTNDDGVTVQRNCDTSWYGGCNHNPSDDCGCTENSMCGCYQTEVRCCQTLGCSITGYKYGNCVTTPSGCCTHEGCESFC
ncbi:hypothetical protein A4G99_04110 [Haladaptatus sp. R4]|uniref:hypothetical protein n=1 Tax=Haladaptatus sp. R4 TaxID=1679489 RepID=UPI0007B4F69C|nr:hypothetical protein [Haladaptatus sp. R4]KZN25653.1 hypothetical protein A4G99_04110 [Haladaptatus sp. R4]